MVLQRDAKNKLTWAESDAKYIARGRRKTLQRKPEWETELAEMNKGKVGRPYKYSDNEMGNIALLRAVLRDSYRDCEGLLREIWGDNLAPDHSTIWKRAGNVMPTFEHVTNFNIKDGVMRLVVDSTGMANSNRGEWIRVHWNVTMGFFKLHFLVDLDTRRILAVAVSDMNGGDAALLPVLLNKLMKKYVGEGIPLQESAFNLILDQMPARADSRADPHQKLLDCWTHEDGDTADQKETKKPAKAKHEDDDTDDQKDIVIDVTEDELDRLESVAGSMLARVRHKLEKKGVHIELRADGGYDSREVFSILKQMGITPVIKIRVNANARAGGVDRARALAVLDQFGGVGGCTNTQLNYMQRPNGRQTRRSGRKMSCMVCDGLLRS